MFAAWPCDWIGHPYAGSGGPQRSLVASAAARRLVALHWRWKNVGAVRQEHAPAEVVAVLRKLRKQFVHAALFLVAARRDKGKNLRF